MARVELQWSTSRCKLRALSQRRLPVIVRTVHGYNGLNDVDQLCTGQIFRVDSAVNEERVLATDDRGRAYSFPKSLAVKCRLLNQRPTKLTGYKKAQYLRTIVDANALPVSILLDNVAFSATLRLAAARAGGIGLGLDAEAPLTLHGPLKLVRQFTEVFYVVNHIVNGVLTAKPQVLPVYVDVDVEVAEGLLTSRPDQRTSTADQCNDQWSSTADQWSALLGMYTRSIRPADIAAITGYDGVLLHSISSDDVTAVRSQLAIDTMSRDFTASRDTSIHHRRRRDRAMFENDKPETEVEIKQRARSYSIPNKMVPDYAQKQALANQNAAAILDHAHDRDNTNHSSERHNSPPSLSTAEVSPTNDVTAKAEQCTNGDGSRGRSRDQTESKSFTWFLRKLTPFRTTSAKRASSVKLVRYTGTDDVEAPPERRASKDRVKSANVRRHSSLSTYDVTSHVSMTPSNRDVIAEPQRRASLSQSDVILTSRGRGLLRPESDLTPTKSRRNTASLERKESLNFASTEPRYRRNSVTSGDAILTSKSPTVLKLAGPTSVTRNHDLVHHQSFSASDNRVASESRELLRHKLQPLRSTKSSSISSVGLDSRGQHTKPSVTKSRNGVAAALQRSVLTRHESMPTVAMSGNDVIMTSRRRDLLPGGDIVAVSSSYDLNHGSQSRGGIYARLDDETTPRRHRLQPQRDVTASSSQSRDFPSTMMQSCPDKLATSELRNSAHETAPTKNPSSDITRLYDPEVCIEPDGFVSTRTRQRHNSLTSRVESHDYVITKSSSVSELRSSSTKPDQLSTYQLSASTDRQNGSGVHPAKQSQSSTHRFTTSTNHQSGSGISGISPTSSLSSDNPDQVPEKPASVSKPDLLSQSKGSQTQDDSTHPVPAPRHNKILPALPRSVSSNDRNRGTPESCVLPPAPTRSNSTKPVPAPRRKARQTPAAQSPQASLSLSSRTVEEVLPNSTSTPSWSSSRQQDQAIHGVPASPHQQKSTQTSSLSLQSLPSTSSAPDYNGIPIAVSTTLREEETTLTTANSDCYSLTYQHGIQEAPADEPSKRRSSRETAINAPEASAAESQPPSHQDGGRETPDDLDDLSESRSRRETANVVVVRPLPTSSHVVYGIDDNVTKSRAGRETICPTPIAIATGRDEEDDMRSRRSSISGVSTASGRKSALRKTSRSHSADRHVSYSNTDTIYRLERLNDPDLTLTSSGGRYLGRPSFFGFRVYDVSGGSEQLAGPPVQCARQNELEFRRTVAQGRYQRLHATAAYVTSDVTMPAVRRHLEANQRRQQNHGQQRRHPLDNYDYDQSYDYYNTYSPRPASVCGFRDVTDNSDDETGLCVQRITVGPY